MFYSLKNLIKKCIKREINMVGGIADNYAYIMALPKLNYSPSADLVIAVYFSQLNNYNSLFQI